MFIEEVNKTYTQWKITIIFQDELFLNLNARMHDNFRKESISNNHLCLLKISA